MQHDLLAGLRATLHADTVTLLQPVVRGDTLLLGRRDVATAEGVTPARDIGRPMKEVTGEASRDRMLEHYHLDGGGVLGVPPSNIDYKAKTGLQPLDAPHLFLPDSAAAHEHAVWLVLDGTTLGLVHATGAGITAEHCASAEPLLRDLRRRLARTFVGFTSKLTGTGVMVVGEDGVEAADERARAWTGHLTEDAPLEGVVGGAIVQKHDITGQHALRVATIRPVRAPKAPVGLLLTPTERGIARYLGTAATLAEIAKARGCSTATIGRHRDNIYAALGVSRRVEVAQALRDI